VPIAWSAEFQWQPLMCITLKNFGIILDCVASSKIVSDFAMGVIVLKLQSDSEDE
jgi:hypothetical protein